MEQFIFENEIPSGTGGTVFPDFSTPFYAKMWNSFLRTNSHEWNGWNSSTGGRPPSNISFDFLDLLKGENDLMGDAYRPPHQLFHPFHPSLVEPKKLFHLKTDIFHRQKGAKPMSEFVKMTCKECQRVFLLEAANPKPGTVARETATCRHLNIMRHGEAFEQHKHKSFIWELAKKQGGNND